MMQLYYINILVWITRDWVEYVIDTLSPYID